MRMLVSAFQFLVFSNIYVSLCAATFTIKTTLLLYGNGGDIKVNALVFFATLFLYCFHRLYHRNRMIPEERGEERHHWADEHKVVFIALTCISFLASAVLMLYMPLRVWLLLVPVAILGLGYSLPFIPTRKKWKRLRDLSWLKIVWIAIAYAWLTSFIPVVYRFSISQLSDPNIICVFIRSFIFVFILVIPFDIRDKEHDAKNGIKTLPILIGTARTIQTGMILLIVFVLTCMFQFCYYQLDVKLTTALLISAVEVAIVLPLSRVPRADIFYPLAIETSMIFHCLVIFLAVKCF